MYSQFRKQSKQSTILDLNNMNRPQSTHNKCSNHTFDFFMIFCGLSVLSCAADGEEKEDYTKVPTFCV